MQPAEHGGCLLSFMMQGYYSRLDPVLVHTSLLSPHNFANVFIKKVPVVKRAWSQVLVPRDRGFKSHQAQTFFIQFF